MEIKINLGDKKRKDLATAVGEMLGEKVEYSRGHRTYTIGTTVLDNDNTLIFDDKTDIETIRELLDDLAENGFITDELPEKLVIQMPADNFDDVAMENLHKLVSAKSELIKKALGADDLPIEKSDKTVNFS